MSEVFYKKLSLRKSIPFPNRNDNLVLNIHYLLDFFLNNNII